LTTAYKYQILIGLIHVSFPFLPTSNVQDQVYKKAGLGLSIYSTKVPRLFVSD